MNNKKLIDSKQKSKEMTLHSVEHTMSAPEIYYNIVHSIHGRIRFSIPRLAIDSEYADKLKALIASDSKVTNIRLNPQAASIAISYKSDLVDDANMRAHLVNLIQTAPNIAPVKQATAKSILAAIFDAVVNLIDSVRNVNKARKGITDGQFKPDFWERALSGVKSMIKGLKSTIMFVLPKRSGASQSLTQSSIATNNE